MVPAKGWPRAQHGGIDTWGAQPLGRAGSGAAAPDPATLDSPATLFEPAPDDLIIGIADAARDEDDAEIGQRVRVRITRQALVRPGAGATAFPLHWYWLEVSALCRQALGAPA